jgi:uncharacterized membrane protein YphA (DoxX/SURF4 family)
VAEPSLAPDAPREGRQPRAAVPTAAAAPPEGSEGSEWSALRLLGFRLVLVYLLVYNLPVAASWIPATSGLIARYRELWQVAVPWVGRHLFHLDHPIATAPNGSGDRTFDYLQVLCIAALAALAALAWTALDRRRRQPRALSEGLRIYLRFTLAWVLLSQGIGKLTGATFPFPAIDRLQERLGDSSPLTLFSTFMGYSPLYAGFVGAGEALGGLLLLFRRTTTLGALLAVAAAAHAAALDFSYDVPEKLLSLHLLAMAAWLLAPDARRLADGLLLERPTRPPDLAPPWSGRAGRWTALGRLTLKTLLVSYALVAIAWHDLDRRRELMRAPRPPLYGVWEVEELVRNGRAEPRWNGDPARWRRLIVRSPESLAVHLASGARQSFVTAYGQQQVTLSSAASAGQPTQRGTLGTSRPDADHLVLQGTMSGEALTVKLRRIDESRVLLLTRGFHLITDVASNR